MIIYKLTSPSGKCYIGKTEFTIEERFNTHIAESKYNSKRPILRAISKYGKDNFALEVLEECNKDNINLKEIYWIEHFNSTDPSKGYNITKGGEGVDSETASKLKKEYWDSPRSNKQKKELSKRMKENNPGKLNKGKPSWNKGLKADDYLTDEQRKVMSDKQKARWDEETRLWRSGQTIELWKNGVYDNRPKPSAETIEKRRQSQIGFKQTDYQKQKAREANLGKITSEETKKKIIENNGSLEKVICPHCGKEGQKRIMKRWHGDNCRSKT